MVVWVGVVICGIVAITILIAVWTSPPSPQNARKPCSILVPDGRSCSGFKTRDSCENNFFLLRGVQYQCRFNERLNSCVSTMDDGHKAKCAVQKDLAPKRKPPASDDHDMFSALAVTPDDSEAHRPCVSTCGAGYECVASPYGDAPQYPRRCERTMCASARNPAEYCGPSAQCVVVADSGTASRCIRTCATDDDCLLRYTTYNRWESDDAQLSYAAAGDEQQTRQQFYQDNRAGGLTCRTMDASFANGLPYPKNTKFCLSPPVASDEPTRTTFSLIKHTVPSVRFVPTKTRGK